MSADDFWRFNAQISTQQGLAQGQRAHQRVDQGYIPHPDPETHARARLVELESLIPLQETALAQLVVEKKRIEKMLKALDD
jgi:hypothetical protein